MATISCALRRIKQDLEPFLPEAMIRDVCCQVGHHWRHRQFDPVATIHLFIQQILNFNTASPICGSWPRSRSMPPVIARRGCVCRCRPCKCCCGTLPKRWPVGRARRGCGMGCGSG